MPDGFWITLVKALVLANLVMGVFAVLTWLERRVLGRFQNRLGPNRVGPFGLLQPIADLVKLIRKESLLPDGIHPALYLLAPVVSLLAATTFSTRSDLLSNSMALASRFFSRTVMGLSAGARSSLGWN